MIITVKIAQVNGNRLARLERELGYVSSADFLRTIPLADERHNVEEYMGGISPRDDSPSLTKRWLAERGWRPMLPKFSTGWRVKRVTVGNQLMWQISHILESSNRLGAQAKFRSVEFGSRTMTWLAPRSFRYRDASGLWHAVEEGQEMIHWGNKPANVIKKTSEYVETVMMPLIASKIRSITERRLAKAAL